MPNSYWSNNLKHLRKRKKVNQENMATQLGITRSKLNSHENGNTINPPVEDLIRFSNFFKISIDNLLLQDFETLGELKLRDLEAGNEAYTKGANLRILTTTVDSQNKENVELVPAKAKAGYTAGYGDPEFIAALPTFHLPHLSPNRKYRMFPISGDSMLPVPDGSFVIGEYLEDWTNLKKQQPAIIITKNEGIVFKLSTLDMDGEIGNWLHLESLNEAYHPYSVPLAEVLEVWVFHNLLMQELPERESSNAAVFRMLLELKEDVKQLVLR